jgi:ADP-heptose:LPS heptosyltransferase
LVSLALQLRKEKFDIALNFHASTSSASLALGSGAKTRSIHFHGHHHKNRFSTVTVPGKGILKPIIERDMDTIRALGIHVPAGRLPSVYLQPLEVQKAKEYITRLGLRAPLLGISLGASRPSKQWPMERYANLAIQWCQKQNGSVLVFSGPNEVELTQLFLSHLDDLLTSTIENPSDRAKVRNRISTPPCHPLRELAALLSQISVLACNDSGPKHLAIAVNTPTVTLFGPEDPFEWHPYPLGEHPYLFKDQLACRKDAHPGMPAWCGISHCTEQEHRCMRLLGINSVLEKCITVAKTPFQTASSQLGDPPL